MKPTYERTPNIYVTNCHRPGITVLNGCKEEKIIVKTKSNQTNRVPQVTDSNTHTPLLRRGLFLLYFKVFCIALALHRAT